MDVSWLDNVLADARGCFVEVFYEAATDAEVDRRSVSEVSSDTDQEGQP